MKTIREAGNAPQRAVFSSHRAPTPEPVEEPEPGKIPPEPEKDPVPDHNPSRGY